MSVCLGAEPKLHQLALLKVGSKHKRIIAELGVDWKMLALILQFDHNVIEAIKDDNRGINEKCCQDMLRRWLDGEACQPVTWERLVEAIRDIPREKLATEIDQLLSHQQ